MLNQILAGHYRIIRTLGEGGLAKTYIAEDLHRPGHPQCAVKYLKPGSADPQFLLTARRLFKNEAEILEKLGQHDQIPRLLAYFEQANEFYLVQELIEGLTLNPELPPGHCWSERKVILFLKDALSILEFVHSYGVIHRDIKPSNFIRRDSDSRLVLIDFGAVKQILEPTATVDTSLRRSTIAIGTEGYIPTEQARGKPRFNSDIYALGMIGIQALTGVDPLQLREDRDGEIIWQDQARVSAELATILNTMVRYHFRDRYQTATEVLQALQSLNSQYSSWQPPPSEQNQTPPAEISKTILPETKVTLETATSYAPVRSEKSPVTPLPETRVISELNSSPEASLPQESRTISEASSPETFSTPLSETKFISETTPLPETKVSLRISPLPETKVAPEPDSLQVTKISEQTRSPSPSSEPLNSDKSILSNTHAPPHLPESESPLAIGTDDVSKRLVAALKKRPWLVGGGIVVALASISLMGSYGYAYWFASRALEQTRSLETATRYEECVQQAKIVSPKYSQLYAQAQELTGKCLLAQAQKLADNNQWEEAIKWVSQIPPQVSAYSQGQKLLEQGQSWKQNEAHLQASQQAFKRKQWSKAIEEAQKISDQPYWQSQAKPIIEKANIEIAKNGQGTGIKENIGSKPAIEQTSPPKVFTAQPPRPKTATVRPYRPKASAARTSRPKRTTARAYRPKPPTGRAYRPKPPTVGSSRPKKSIARSYRPKKSIAHSYRPKSAKVRPSRQVPSRSLRPYNDVVPRDNSGRIW